MKYFAWKIQYTSKDCKYRAYLDTDYYCLCPEAKDETFSKKIGKPHCTIQNCPLVANGEKN